MSKPHQQSPSALEQPTAMERHGLVSDYLLYLRSYKRWYLIPLAVLLILVALYLFSQGDDVSPYTYDI